MGVEPAPAGRAWLAPWLCWGGLLASGAAVLAYFTVVPSLSSDWRDSGNVNLALAAAGALACAAGWIISRRRGERRNAGWITCLAASGLTAFLAYFLHVHSYRLPPAGNVLDVGAKAPSFRLRDQQGRERALEELDARRLILVFFRGHW